MRGPKESLYERLRAYAKDGLYPFHMPGHKRNGSLLGDPADALEIPYGIDITEIEGFDNLHQPEGILRESMARAARLYGARETFYLVGGSTCGLLAGISACTEPGDRILMARNCHKAVYHAVYLRGLRPVYLYPEIEEEFGICGGIAPEDVRAALKEYPDIRLVVIVSPTYEGIVSDIGRIAEAVHEAGIPLLVDEAHGAHLGFGFGFPDSSVHQGADLVIHSVHKTLPAPTQTALLHLCGELAPCERVRQFLGIYQSSSPSYILMAGIERCLDLVERRGAELFTDWKERLAEFYEGAEGLKRIRVFQGGMPAAHDRPSKRCGRKAQSAADARGRAAIASVDPSKLVISVKETGYGGEWLYRRLIRDYRLMPEMASGDYIICMTGPGDTRDGMKRLLDALYEIDRVLEEQEKNEDRGDGSGPADYGKYAGITAMTEEYSWQVQTRGRSFDRVLLAQSEGLVSAEYVWLYPPGIPILVPGERVTEEILAALSAYRRSGLALGGMSDGAGETILVCRRENAPA